MVFSKSTNHTANSLCHTLGFVSLLTTFAISSGVRLVYTINCLGITELLNEFFSGIHTSYRQLISSITITHIYTGIFETSLMTKTTIIIKNTNFEKRTAIPAPIAPYTGISKRFPASITIRTKRSTATNI